MRISPAPTEQHLQTVTEQKDSMLPTTIHMKRRQHVTGWRTRDSSVNWRSYTNDGQQQATSEGQRLVRASRRIVLRDQMDRIVAVCIRQVTRWQQEYFSIFRTTPVYSNQEPSEYVHDGIKLYWWAECKERFTGDFIIEVGSKPTADKKQQRQQLFRTKGFGSNEIRVQDSNTKSVVGTMRIQKNEARKRDARIEMMNKATIDMDRVRLLVCTFAILNEF